MEEPSRAVSGPYRALADLDRRGILEIEPCRSIVLDPVRTRGVPLVIVGREETTEDSTASVVIHGGAESVLPCACRSISADWLS
jgi:hypothetical protein